MSDVVILRTGRLYEADMLALALTEASIPHYRREENFAGLKLAMPAMPAPGPGTFFSVLVPEIAADDARQVLAELPIEPEDPGLWSFSPTPRGQKLFKIYAAIVLIAILIGTFHDFINKLF